MSIPAGLQTSLNAIRETLIQSNTLYAEQIDEIMPTSDIGSFAKPFLEYPTLMNAFIAQLAQKIVYTQIDIKLFRNPLEVLEGDELPIGAIGEEIYINPVKGRKFNVDDFAGLLAKYEADVKVQYMHLNSDIQYPVTITRPKLKDAFKELPEALDDIAWLEMVVANIEEKENQSKSQLTIVEQEKE